MKTSIRLLLLVAILSPPLACAGAPENRNDAGAATPPVSLDPLALRIEGFRRDLVELRRRLGIPGLSVAVARDGEILFSEGFGLADVAEERPATADTPYRIASITKTMTAAIVVALAEEGRLELDAPLGSVLDEAPPWAAGVTVRHLLTHTSEGDPPGAHFTYSGRYNVLSRVASEAAGRSFAELLVERIFVPAGMERSYPVSLSGSARARAIGGTLATPYFPDGSPATSEVLPDETSGGNGVVSTVVDLVRWIDALREGEILPDRAIEALWTPAAGERRRPMPYGLGWWVEETPHLDLVYHGGQWPVYSGLLLHDRISGLTLAVLANHSGVSRPFYGIGTGTALYSVFAASFLRHFALDEVWEGGPGGDSLPWPALPWGVAADSLGALVGSREDPEARLHLGSELFGRALLARARGEPARADSLLRTVVSCCPAALEVGEDLGILFHLGRSDDPDVRELGIRAGERRISVLPDDPTTRFNLAAALVGAGRTDRATQMLRSLFRREGDVPTWMWSWSGYLLAEALAPEHPVEARRIMERVLEEGVDEGGLFSEARALLDELDWVDEGDREASPPP